jgi:hypothetical protein
MRFPKSSVALTDAPFLTKYLVFLRSWHVRRGVAVQTPCYLLLPNTSQSTRRVGPLLLIRGFPRRAAVPGFPMWQWWHPRLVHAEIVPQMRPRSSWGSKYRL